VIEPGEVFPASPKNHGITNNIQGDASFFEAGCLGFLGWPEPVVDTAQGKELLSNSRDTGTGASTSRDKAIGLVWAILLADLDPETRSNAGFVARGNRTDALVLGLCKTVLDCVEGFAHGSGELV